MSDGQRQQCVAGFVMASSKVTGSTAGSIGFLIIFAMVNYAGFKLAPQTGSNKIVPFMGFVFCGMAMIVLLEQQFSSNKMGVIVAVSILVSCFAIEAVYKWVERQNK